MRSVITIGRAVVASLLVLGLLIPRLSAHVGSINLFVDASNQLYPLETFQIPQFQKFLDIEISADGPGFVVNFPINGVMPGSEFMLEVTQDLMYWDGSGLAPSQSTFLLGAPEFDNQGTFITSPVTAFPVTADSGVMTGMTFGTYNGAQFWEAHGLNFLEPLDSPAGVYGVGVRLRTPNHLDTKSFVIPFVYDPENVWDTAEESVGIDRLRQATAAHAIADLNYDGHVNSTDVDLVVAEIAGGGSNLDLDLSGDGVISSKDLQEWLRQGGIAQLKLADSYSMGDANLDGAVDLSDFHIWNQNKFTTSAGWSAGDFNADGNVDVLDFDLWNENRFTTAGGAAAAVVPEPNWVWPTALILLGWLARCRRGLHWVDDSRGMCRLSS